MKIYKYPSNWMPLLERPTMETQDLESIVRAVLNQVKKQGDNAVKSYTKQFDKVDLEALKVNQKEIELAVTQVPETLKKAIQQAKKNIEKFHESQQEVSSKIETMKGLTCWRKSVPIDKVGLYIPAGSAPLFSTVLMLGVPAKIAGCQEIILCSPPQQDGTINPVILYTASLVGCTQIFKIGGVQAVGAMAYGTESVPKVYKIFGPGNQYVTCAKQLISQMGTAIDMPAGPSELLVWADETANPAFVAADLLSQAEHGEDSQVILVANQESILEAVQEELAIQVEQLPRKEIALAALENSRAILLKTVEESLDFINQYAPEHLILNLQNAVLLAEKITNAGSVFLGNYTPESLGDYASGTNHTLPTNGYARSYSGVSLDSFVKKITFQQATKKGLENIGWAVEAMAAAEQLQAHKNAVTIRLSSLALEEETSQVPDSIKTIEELICPHILKMQAYSSARSEFKGKATVFLDANENPFQTEYNRYPDPLQLQLKGEIALLKEVDSNQIFLGNGSDEAIDLLLRLCCNAGQDAIITLPPTYGMYAVSANLCKVQNIEIPLTADFQPDVEAILKAQNQRTKLLFICSPNNPTGNDIDLNKVEFLIQNFDGIVVVDEAYIDFSEQSSCLKWLKKYSNLVALQTFSKAWGMAGLRLGMAFANEALIELLNKIKPPYNINALTQEFALKQLKNKTDVRYTILNILAQRKQLEKGLKQLPFVQKTFPSSSNFILVKVDNPNAIYKHLIQYGIVVRNRNTVLLCEGCLRITVGTKQENDLLLTTLFNFLNNSKNEQESIIPRPRWDFSH